jgi:hypothetical protein
VFRAAVGHARPRFEHLGFACGVIGVPVEGPYKPDHYKY